MCGWGNFIIHSHESLSIIIDYFPPKEAIKVYYRSAQCTLFAFKCYIHKKKKKIIINTHKEERKTHSNK